MRFAIEYPSDVPTADAEFREPAVMKAIASDAERLGFDAIALSEHPAPSAKWRRSGGHDTFDPTVALAFFAAATDKIRLMTNLYVLPFRSPYMAAKALTSLDIVSGGRLIAGVGAGYLRSEFSAVGAEFDSRTALFDESLAALRRLWTHPEEPVTGSTYAATGEVNLDAPIQKPHPPIWIGGNSIATLRRVVEHGSGWCPVVAPAKVASSVRTAAIEGADDFSRAVDKLSELLIAAGRDVDSVEIQVAAPTVDFDDAHSVGRLGEFVEGMTEAGATRVLVHVDATSVSAAEKYLTRFAERFGMAV